MASTIFFQDRYGCPANTSCLSASDITPHKAIFLYSVISCSGIAPGVSWTAGSLFRVIVIIVEFAVLAAPTVILLQIICERRAGRKDSALRGNMNTISE
ncbi:hypothetical protein QQF64_026169 [Cirrhinus molitorella]|uniref:Uncharacterized protein n=1 Tax=Cirrhinus molitorella TaxID=172907 RepID=A0ABR3NRS9_9TELE